MCVCACVRALRRPRACRRVDNRVLSSGRAFAFLVLCRVLDEHIGQSEGENGAHTDLTRHRISPHFQEHGHESRGEADRRAAWLPSARGLRALRIGAHILRDGHAPHSRCNPSHCIQEDGLVADGIEPVRAPRAATRGTPPACHNALRIVADYRTISVLAALPRAILMMRVWCVGRIGTHHRRQRISRPCTVRAVLQNAPQGHSRGAHRYSRALTGTHGVLTGYSRGTHGRSARRSACAGCKRI